MQGVKPTEPLVQPVLDSPKIDILESRLHWWLFGASVLLVTLPVFVQAPLVRQWPTLSLLASLGWLGTGSYLRTRPRLQLWGDLLIGFTLAWFAGSIYWGWFRWEPLLHIPLEAIALPFAIWAWRASWCRVGMGFYLGSLLGTAITDLYFYLVDLIPFWRSLLRVDQTQAFTVLQSALVKVQTPWGSGWAMALILALCVIGIVPLLSGSMDHDRRLYRWVFSGAVLGTLMVDSLFLLVATRF
ncbi:hypothetical protein C1752_01314 [Acaryochloris thomasi RCC1774]|uniref:DUF3120 domain-containing protein n=1 Tax=Acaryochloris thomasi RCC1774 TaxID=1764569 RepID=A0A2W1JLN1_9CYAN|nr:DUF3120 domain-containing protein [Acaryochloris thomasi]PZD74290.1 hypothetical protein C1752_01314 [Acaryochloris thomasi RCC1774]